MNDAISVVIDTSALYALLSATDRFHAVATQTYEGLLHARGRLWVTSHVLVEFGVIVQKRLGFEVLSAFYRATEGSVDVIWVDRQRHEQAWAGMEASRGRGLNLVDRTVLLGAKEIGAQIFTFDSGFRGQGVTLLPELMR